MILSGLVIVKSKFCSAIYLMRVACEVLALIFILLLSSCTFHSSPSDTSDKVLHRHDPDPVVLAPLSQKEWKIGVLVPLSGNHAALGMQVVDAVTLALFNLHVPNVKIVVLDIGNTEASAIIAANDAVRLNIDIAIGPIFSNSVKIVGQILANNNINSIVLSNDTSVARQGVHVFGVSVESQMQTILSFTNRNGYENLAVILPSNKHGFHVEKSIANVAKQVGINHRMTAYYNVGNENLYENVAKKLSAGYRFSLKSGKDGKLYQDDISRIERRKRASHKDDASVIHGKIDAIYIDASGRDLYLILAEVNKLNILNDVLLLSNDNIWDDVLFSNPYADGMIFATVITQYVLDFENYFFKHWKYRPNSIAILSYDAATTIMQMLKEGKDPSHAMYAANGFTGLYGDFVFSKNGLVRRRFNIYRVMSKKLDLLETSNTFM